MNNNNSSTILDSSLIFATSLENKLAVMPYNIKVILCGDYTQVYFYEDNKMRGQKREKNYSKNSHFNFDRVRNLREFDDVLSELDNTSKSYEIKEKNIIRSKLNCQRLAKCNSNIWETFITLTFKENITDVFLANKEFHKFVTKVKRVFKMFKYICVPEFQKRGAVHYHLLTNVSIDNDKIIYKQKNRSKFYHVKYWLCGFDKVDYVSGDIKKIVGYISKYMTKDIDNRLYGHQRYLFSKDLFLPKTLYFDLSNNEHFNEFLEIMKDKKIIYENEFKSNFSQEKIMFKEYLKE